MSFILESSELAGRVKRLIRGVMAPSYRSEVAWPTVSLRSSLSPAIGDRSESEFDYLALELFEFQFEHNVPYRRFCDAAGANPKSVEHWRRIPAVVTSAFKELEFSCLPESERTTVFHSSGTTQQRPSRHYHSHESLSVYDAAVLAWFGPHLLGDNFQGGPTKRMQAVFLTPPPCRAPHSSLVHMFETVRSSYGWSSSAFVGSLDGADAWGLDCKEAVKRLLNSCESGEPVCLLGTAFSFVHLLDHLAERHLRFSLPPGSRALETGGYKGRSRALSKGELYREISRRLGIPPSQIVSEYGMNELSSQGYDLTVPLVAPRAAPAAAGAASLRSNSDRWFRFPPWARVQLISPETGQEVQEGEVGLIRVFDLANVFSVLAVQTEDLGRRCAHGFELVGRAARAESRGCSLMSV